MALQAALNAAASMRLPIIALIAAEVKEAPKAKRLDFSVPNLLMSLFFDLFVQLVSDLRLQL